jgi:uncharacterized membrane protein (TIGR02234 family)
MRRGLLVAVLLCAAGAGLLLLSSSRTWVTVHLAGAGQLPGTTSALSGATVSPGARALAVLGLAGAAALPATRGWGRRLVGALLVLAGGVAGSVVAGVLRDPGVAAAAHVTDPVRVELTAGPYAALLGAVLLLVAGVLAVVRGGSWGGLGARYDAPTSPRAPSLWEALDDGHDPTA